MVLPEVASARANSHDGSMIVTLSVDKSPAASRADVGSKPWLLAHALRNKEEDRGFCADSQEDERRLAGDAVAKVIRDVGQQDEDTLPEDRFHLRLPKGEPRHLTQL